MSDEVYHNFHHCTIYIGYTLFVDTVEMTSSRSEYIDGVKLVECLSTYKANYDK